jgi:hypothetical protein
MLDWVKTKHEKGHLTNHDMPDHIVWEAKLPFSCTLSTWSHPYSQGEFTAECSGLRFGGKTYWLGTKDESEAKIFAERYLRQFLVSHIKYHAQMLEVL